MTSKSKTVKSLAAKKTNGLSKVPSKVAKAAAKKVTPKAEVAKSVEQALQTAKDVQALAEKHASKGNTKTAKALTKAATEVKNVANKTAIKASVTTKPASVATPVVKKVAAKKKVVAKKVAPAKKIITTSTPKVSNVTARSKLVLAPAPKATPVAVKPAVHPSGRVISMKTLAATIESSAAPVPVNNFDYSSKVPTPVVQAPRQVGKTMTVQELFSQMNK